MYYYTLKKITIWKLINYLKFKNEICVILFFSELSRHNLLILVRKHIIMGR